MLIISEKYMNQKLEQIVRERKAERQAIIKAEKHRLYAAFLESGLTIDEAEIILLNNKKDENVLKMKKADEM